MMKNLIKADIRYFFISKAILWIFLLFGILCFANSFMCYQYAHQSLQQYRNTYNYMVESGADIESELSKDYILHEGNNIENPLSYFKEQAEKSMRNISPQNIFTSFGESCTIFAPIIAVLVAALLVSYDEKNKTARLKVARNGKKRFVISKQISGILLLLTIIFVGFGLTAILNRIFYNDLQSISDISPFTINFAQGNNILHQIIYVFLVTVIFFEIGYTISNIFHCYTAITIVVSVISFFAPPFLKYDPINLKCHFESKIFLFEGVVTPTTSIPISTSEAVIELIILATSIIIINYVTSVKKSAYN